MLSSMSPTIVEENGQLKMVLGSPGGSIIITTVMQNILNVLDYNMTMQESVSKPRFHHQWLPDNIKFEPSFDSVVFGPLKKLGYKIDHSNSKVIGKRDAIWCCRTVALKEGQTQEVMTKQRGSRGYLVFLEANAF